MYDGLDEKLLVKSDVHLMFRVTKLEWAKAASNLAAPDGQFNIRLMIPARK